MAKKDFDEYFEQVAAQYEEMQENLKEIEKEDLPSEETVEALKKLIEPLKNNYLTLSYVKFLLDKPVRKEKSNWYVKNNKRLLESVGNRTKECVVNENDNIIKQMKG